MSSPAAIAVSAHETVVRIKGDIQMHTFVLLWLALFLTIATCQQILAVSAPSMEEVVDHHRRHFFSEETMAVLAEKCELLGVEHSLSGSDRTDGMRADLESVVRGHWQTGQLSWAWHLNFFVFATVLLRLCFHFPIRWFSFWLFALLLMTAGCCAQAMSWGLRAYVWWHEPGAWALIALFLCGGLVVVEFATLLEIYELRLQVMMLAAVLDDSLRQQLSSANRAAADFAMDNNNLPNKILASLSHFNTRFLASMEARPL